MAKGIVFTPQSSNPLSGSQRGFWVNASGDVVYSDTVTDRNISQSITNLEDGTGITALSRMYLNSSGSTIAAGKPVYSPATGEIALADGTTATKARIIGVTLESINNGQSGKVVLYGVIAGVSGHTHGRYLYLGDDPGEFIDVEPTLGPYPSGFYVVIVGILDGTNLIVRPQLVGTL